MDALDVRRFKRGTFLPWNEGAFSMGLKYVNYIGHLRAIPIHAYSSTARGSVTYRNGWRDREGFTSMKPGVME
ncbi:MAG: hypothetical protein M0019_02180 [Actinomycetota bacterium]|nr:hypothetical protein [Actinomycetota bacterium]